MLVKHGHGTPELREEVPKRLETGLAGDEDAKTERLLLSSIRRSRT